MFMVLIEMVMAWVVIKRIVLPGLLSTLLITLPSNPVVASELAPSVAILDTSVIFLKLKGIYFTRYAFLSGACVQMVDIF
jgi:hypothetical protein